MTVTEFTRSLNKLYYRFLLQTIIKQLCSYVYNDNPHFKNFVETNYANRKILEKYCVDIFPIFEPRDSEYYSNVDTISKYVLQVGLPFYGLFESQEEYIYFDMIANNGQFHDHDLILKTGNIINMLRYCLKSSRE